MMDERAQNNSVPMSEHPLTTYELGQHVLEVGAEEQIMITNELIALELDREEAYKLYLVLHACFSRTRLLIDTPAPYTT